MKMKLTVTTSAYDFNTLLLLSGLFTFDLQKHLLHLILFFYLSIYVLAIVTHNFH